MPRPGIRKGLVVDTCIGTSASEAESKFAAACRNLLESLLGRKVRAAFSDELSTEWQRHASRFGLRWLVAMESRRLVVHHGNVRDEKFRSAINSAGLSGADRLAAATDAHLLETALAACRIILSRDSEARRVFAEASRRLRQIERITWLDVMSVREEELRIWLDGGCPAVSDAQLRSLRQRYPARK